MHIPLKMCLVQQPCECLVWEACFLLCKWNRDRKHEDLLLFSKHEVKLNLK